MRTQKNPGLVVTRETFTFTTAKTVQISGRTVTKEGYTPLSISMLPGPYCDYFTINAGPPARSGDSVVFASIYLRCDATTPGSSSSAYIAYDILWQKK